ncbi:uncharacterized protein [Drosophila tropicalis]|uniref:uncharacterized protein n=1 Tax=Drosophila tropicalis TaxID=46794 RepID=UPI0035AC18AE
MLKLDTYPLRTHYMKNGLWFTEDNIPVRKVFLTNIPEVLKDESIFKHFISFGHVISVKIFDNTKRTSVPNRKFGFVLFANASAATKALETKIHHVEGHKIYVIVADSWHQPDFYRASEPQNAGGQSGEAYILKLPDDCLSMILKLLPLADQVHFYSVCKRFQSVYQLTTRSIHKSVDLQDLEDLTLWDIREFFRISGPYVMDLNSSFYEYSKFGKRLFKYFGRNLNLNNLKSLDLSAVDLSIKNMVEIFSSTSKLENLKLYHCNLTDEKLLTLKSLKSLKKLNLALNSPLSGLHMEKLPFLIENLNLEYCDRVQSSHLIKMCISLTQLKELNIGGFYTDYAEVFQSMVKNGSCPLLERLGLSICGRYGDIAHLPKLKSIYIYGISENSHFTKVLEQLVLFKSEQLEELKIKLRFNETLKTTKQMLMQIGKFVGLKTLSLSNALNIDNDVLGAFTNLKELEHINLAFCKQINDSNISLLVLGCPKLQKVNLEGCSQISKNLLDDIIWKMPIYYKNNERKLPIEIYLKSCRFLETPPAQDTVKIIWDQPKQLKQI